MVIDIDLRLAAELQATLNASMVLERVAKRTQDWILASIAKGPLMRGAAALLLDAATQENNGGGRSRHQRAADAGNVTGTNATTVQATSTRAKITAPAAVAPVAPSGYRVSVYLHADEDAESAVVLAQGLASSAGLVTTFGSIDSGGVIAADGASFSFTVVAIRVRVAPSIPKYAAANNIDTRTKTVPSEGGSGTIVAVVVVIFLVILAVGAVVVHRYRQRLQEQDRRQGSISEAVRRGTIRKNTKDTSVLNPAFAGSGTLQSYENVVTVGPCNAGDVTNCNRVRYTALQAQHMYVVPFVENSLPPNVVGEAERALQDAELGEYTLSACGSTLAVLSFVGQ